MSTLKDADDLDLSTADRGDELEVVEKDADPTAEEKALAESLKTKKKDEEKKDEKVEDKKTDEDEDEDEDKGKKRDSRIPLARHKSLIEAERAERAKLEARLAQYEQGEDIAKTNEELTKAETKLLEMEGQYTSMLADGKTAEAAKLMGDIRKVERFINSTNSELRAVAAEARAYERARYDVTVERVEAAYPVLNPDHDDYEPTKVKKVLSVAHAYQIDGMTPSKALQEAVKDLIGEPETAKQKTAVETTARVSEADKKKAERAEAAREKATDAAGRQPPSLNKAGADTDKLGGKSLSAADVMKMPFSDFKKLDEATLASLRGDEV